MDHVIPILSLLIVTGLFIIGFIFSGFFKDPTSVVDKEQKIEFVVADMIESLRKICPVGTRKGWTLVSAGCSLPRSWKKGYVFPFLTSDIALHGSSVIVKSPVWVIKDLISKPVHWDEWDSSYFSSSMNQLENDSSNLKRDKHMKCVLVTKDEISYSQDNASMFCFKNLPPDKVRWILFWSITSFDWWFFLIQPAVRKQGTDTTKCDNDLAKAVWRRIRNIKDTAELHSFKVFPFDPLLEYPSSPCANLDESTKHRPSCKKRSHTMSCTRKVFTEKDVLPENSSEVLLQIVSSSECETATSRNSKKFNIRVVDATPMSFIQESKNSNSGPQDEIRCSTTKKRSMTAASSGTISSGGDSQQLLQEVSCKLQTKNMSSVTSSNSVLPDRFSRTNSERCSSPVSRFESSISKSKCSSVELQDATSTARESEPRPSTKRKSFVESIRRVSGILSVGSSLKLDADVSKSVVVETQSHSEIHDDKLVVLTSDSNATGAGNSVFYDADISSGPHDGSTANNSGCETILANESDSLFSNDKSVTCKGNCSPICDVCLEAAYELSDYEVLLPRMDTSEERIADLLTKGNYCAAELQAEVHEASQAKNTANSERKNSNGKWTHVSSNKDIDLYCKTKEERSLKIMSYLSQTSFSVSPDKLWNIIRTPSFRFICDETAKKVTVLEELPDQQKIVYTYHEFGGLLKKEAMDFCLLHSERVEQSKYSVAYLSTEYENCPLSCATRGMLFPSGWVIEKLKGNSDECKVSYLTQFCGRVTTGRRRCVFITRYVLIYGILFAWCCLTAPP